MTLDSQTLCKSAHILLWFESSAEILRFQSSVFVCGGIKAARNFEISKVFYQNSITVTYRVRFEELGWVLSITGGPGLAGVGTSSNLPVGGGVRIGGDVGGGNIGCDVGNGGARSIS